MPVHDIDYRLIGDDLQIVEVELDPGEAVRAEAGAMLYMDLDRFKEINELGGHQAGDRNLESVEGCGAAGKCC